MAIDSPAAPPRPGRGRRREWLLAAAIFGALAAAFVLHEVLGSPARAGSPSTADLLRYYYPTLRYGFAELSAGRLPLWNPHQSLGSPLLAIPHVGFFYPLYLPFWVLPTERAIDLDIALHLAGAGLAMFALCRHFALGVPAALLAGIVYAFQGSTAVKINFPNFLACTIWIPALFWLADRALLRPTRRGAAALAAAVGAALLGTNAQFLYFTGLALLPFGLWRAASRAGRDGAAALARPAALLAGAALLGAGLAAVRLLPGAEFVGQSWRPPGTLGIELAARMSMDPGRFAENLLAPDPAPYGTALSGIDVARQAYMGSLPLVLAAVGLLFGRPRSAALPIALAGLGAALYSFGPQSFVFPALAQLPAGTWFRGPERALIVTGFAVAFLCGAGLERLLAGGAAALRRRTVARWAPAGVAGALALALALAPGELRGLRLVAAHVALGATLLTAARATHGPARAALLLALAVAVAGDLFHAYRHDGAVPSQLPSYRERHAPFFAEIRQRQEQERSYAWPLTRVTHPAATSDLPKAGLNHGVWLVTDYEPLAGARYTRYLGEFGERPWRPPALRPPGRRAAVGYRPLFLKPENRGLFDLLGVRFLLAEAGGLQRHTRALPGLRRRTQPLLRRRGVVLYEYEGALPRAFLVHRVETVETPLGLLARMRRADLGEVAFVEAAPEGVPAALRADPVARGDAPTEPFRSARIVGYEPNRVEVEVAASRPALLVLSDQYAPGWRARVDGEPAPVYRTDFLFRGVPVPAGAHRVTLRYQPTSFWLGAAGSLLALAVTGALALPRRRRRPPGDGPPPPGRPRATAGSGRSGAAAG